MAEFIAMNRFKVALGSEADFEDVWLSRESKLGAVPGFNSFKMLKGESRTDHTLYVSHSTWDTYEAFIAWTKSEAFRAAHKNVGDKKPLYLEAPNFEGFSVIQTEAAV
ncbi:MAG: antibiotic biosynthesis monooxygenase [Hyphomicrobiales bacterium]